MNKRLLIKLIMVVFFSVCYFDAIGSESTNPAFIMGKQSYRHEKFHEAIKMFTQAIEYEPDLVNAYYLRGNSYYSLKQYQSAILDYSKTIELDSKYIYAYVNRGISYRIIQKYDLSILDFSTILSFDSVYYSDSYRSLYYFHRGSTYFKQTKYNHAIKDFSKAIKLNPLNILAYIERGRSYECLGNGDKAISDYYIALENAPEDFEDIQYLQNKIRFLRNVPSSVK